MTTMSLAPAVTTRTVYGRALNPDGTPAKGHVEFMSSLTHLDAADNVTIVDGTITAPIDRNTGNWRITVPVTDDPDLEPAIAAYTVRIAGARTLRTITVPTPAGSDTGDLRYVDAQDSVLVPAAMIGVALTGLTIGRVTTLAPGSLGTAELVGGAPEPELLLGIPQGPQGARPVIQLGTITTGAPGSSVQITWSGVGSVAAPYVVNFTIPRGDTGATGPSPVFATPTATSLAVGAAPTVTKSGAGTAASPLALTFGIPKGEQGAPGTPGAALIDDNATSTTAAWSASKIRSLLLTPRAREIGILTDCVIVGSSNAVASTWTAEFCSSWGLTQRNFAIAGSAFTGSNGFQSQLTSAANDASFANANVGLVVICDASNSIRAANDTGTFPSVASEADAAFAYARSTFPNARIVCLPVIWPADPQAQVAGVPGGYQRIWHAALRHQVDQIRTAARVRGVEVIEDTWTWLTGTTGTMESSGGVHPNAAGYSEIARWLGRYLRGESTRRDTPWTDVPYTNAKVISGDRKLQVMREGWRVQVAGSMETTAASSGYTDLGTLPVGFRPVPSTELPVRQNGTAANLGAIVYEGGTLRLWSGYASGAQFYTAGTFLIG